MKKYFYNRIHCFQTYGTWDTEYITESGKVFRLTAMCYKTKSLAYKMGKEQVDYLNERGQTR